MANDELDQLDPNSSIGDKHLVVVLHGIGNSAAGSTVAAFARAVAATAPGRSLSPTHEVLWLPEDDEGHAAELPRQAQVFPSHVERIRDAGGETVFAEVTWEDLSRVSSTAFGTLAGLIRLIFGLGHIARHASDPRRRDGRPDPAAKLLQTLSNLVAYWLRGPVAALTLVAVLPTLMLNGIILFRGSAREAENSALVVDTLAVPLLLSVSILLAVVGLSMLRRSRGAWTFFLWLGLAGLVHAILQVVQVVYPDSFDLTDKESIHRIGKLFYERSKILGLSMAIPTVLLAVWMLLTVVAWLVARLRSPAEYRPGLDATCAVAALSTGMWAVAIATAMAPLLVKLTDSIGLAIQREAFPMYGIHGLGIILLVLAALATIGARWRWKRTASARNYHPHRSDPRLLLGNWIRYVLIFIAVVGPSIFLWQILRIIRGLPHSFEMFKNMDVDAIRFGAVVGAGVAYFIAHLSFGLDLGLDIISYFRRETPRNGGGPDFQVRMQIQNRLRIVLRTLVGREGPDRLTVVAHSQGTVIAVDVLADEKSEALLTPLRQCDLVTMGSPFHHLYQHYFPNDYPPLKDARWVTLHKRVDRWVNIFRIDDFVGTHIEPDGGWPVNCPVDAGGHTGYWSDRQVLEILRTRKLV